MPSSDKLKILGQREAPPLVMIIGVIVLVLALGTGGYFVFNGGWKTTGQQEYEYQHETLPIYAAKHGNKEAFDAENELRKQHGEAPLVMPADKKSGTNSTNTEDFRKLQDQLRAKGAGQ